MKADFLGKKILFFSPSFFGYEKEIKNRVESFGAIVDFYDVRLKNDFKTKALLRINKRIIKKTIDKYYFDIAEKTSHIIYDYVFFIIPESISKAHIIELRKKQKKAKFILYMWDSIRNRNLKEILPFLDKKFSFDIGDCNNETFGFRHLPLFYLNEYAKLAGKKCKKEFDLIFIGTIHSDRHKILREIENECKKHELNYFFYMYFQNKWMYYFNKIQKRSLWRTKSSDFKFEAISKEKILNIVNQSTAVVDIQHPNQQGLTMRTMEMIGSEKKLITTNQNIAKYDFYSSKNIHVLDRNRVSLSKDFFSSPFIRLDEKISQKYSIDGWLNEIFKENDF